MASKITGVRFMQSFDMLKIGGGHRSSVDNGAAEGGAGGGVRVTAGQLNGVDGIYLRRAGVARWLWLSLDSPMLAAIDGVDESETAPVKK